MPCNLGEVVSRVNQFSNHPNQFKFNGRVFVSSFAGGCLGDSGWANVKAQTNAYIMPFISGLEGQFNNWRSLDSWLWYAAVHLPSASSHRFLQFKLGLCLAPRELPENCGRSLNQTVTKLNNSHRQKTIIIVKTCLFVSFFSLIISSNRFGSAGQSLCHVYQWLGIVRQSSNIAMDYVNLTVHSSHFGYKNFYLRGDDWLIVNRWEQLVAMRDQLTFVEMVTW